MNSHAIFIIGLVHVRTSSACRYLKGTKFVGNGPSTHEQLEASLRDIAGFVIMFFLKQVVLYLGTIGGKGYRRGIC